ncbi:hypothetical protein ACJIZ3_001328 [Penstemon smallii]|uniref:TF-B3 domain-containing protein n=1 Tax=Penstemon smallii TaxID=265156 RepID=A0ABD3U655_9LAMI
MVVAKKSTYEEMRAKRLEENKKRMEQLNLNKLAQALRTPNMKKVKAKIPKLPLDPSSIRRSSRVADKPPVIYKEVAIEPMGGRPRSYTTTCKRRDLSNRVYASDQDRAFSIQRAEDFQSSLDQHIPTFVKPMLQSHVTGGFWLGLPVHFCKKHLPKRDEIINLVDEKEEEFPTKYLSLKTGLSGGWRGFAIDHELVDGDALVFQLTEPTTFKVYIIRVNEPGESDN